MLNLHRVVLAVDVRHLYTLVRHFILILIEVCLDREVRELAAWVTLLSLYLVDVNSVKLLIICHYLLD